MKNSSRTGFSLSQFSSSTGPKTDRLKPVLLEARNLRKTFPAPSSAFAMGTSRSNGGAPSSVTAVDDVSLDLAAGETLAIVGESGSGKTTLARMLLRLIEPDSGELRVDGRDFLAARGAELRALRREMQMVFQDPFASLDPRMRVGAIVAEPLEIHEPQLSRAERRSRVVEMLRAAGLGEDAPAATLTNFPAASASASASRAPSCSARASSSRMNRFPRSTFPLARRFSSCCKICSAISRSPTC
jgi:ABC-type microcin C transport system duplicated ATPase subunit YejF